MPGHVIKIDIVHTGSGAQQQAEIGCTCRENPCIDLYSATEDEDFCARHLLEKLFFRGTEGTSHLVSFLKFPDRVWIDR